MSIEEAQEVVTEEAELLRELEAIGANVERLVELTSERTIFAASRRSRSSDVSAI